MRARYRDPRWVTGAFVALFFCLSMFNRQANAAETPATQAAPADEKAFDVHEFRVLGNSVLPTIDVERSVYPYLGDKKTLKDVEGARLALENIYHSKGYLTVFVDIPEQSVDDGVVRLRVTEGRINQTRVTGAKYFSERQIRNELPQATPGTVPEVSALQAQIAAVNQQSPDRIIAPILKAGPTPGTVDLNLTVDDHLPLHGSVEVNNQYTPDTAHIRALFSLSYANLFGEFDNIGVQYQTSPQRTNQVGVLAATYTSRLLFDTARFGFLFINSSSDVATVGTIGVLGKGQVYGTRFIFPLQTNAAGSHSLTLGADYKHFGETINVDPTNSLFTPISYLNLSLAYSGLWRSDPRIWSFNMSANFGPRRLINADVDFANKRFHGYSNYFYLRGDGSLVSQLPAGFTLTTRLGGQYAIEPTISNENYSIAGADGVRGYLEAEELGDMAIKGTFQLGSPLLHWGTQALGDVFVFFDAGRVGFQNPLPGEPGELMLSSWGAGLDLFPGHAMTATLTIADPLRTAARTRSHESQFLFLIRGSF